MTTDTSKEAVERLAKTADLFAKAMKAWQHKTQKHNEDVRDTLRALSAERDALAAENAKLRGQAAQARTEAEKEGDDRGICPDCQGSGESGPDQICQTCNGSGAEK